jgi:hypothetical protein
VPDIEHRQFSRRKAANREWTTNKRGLREIWERKMPFKIRVGDEVMNHNENQVGIVMEETPSTYLVLIATEDVTKTWSKTEAKGWRQKISNKALDQTEKKASEKHTKTKGVSTPIVYRKVTKKKVAAHK